MDKYKEAIKALNSLIKKSRVHLYKPIQIAEILYHDRVFHDIDLKDKEDYRNKSKKWRDEITDELLGRKCTSSQKFQDNLFEDNAIPPKTLKELGELNIRYDGAVEAYIYSQFTNKYDQLGNALDYCSKTDKSTFDVKKLIDSFWNEPGLKRSIDKVYEIIVYALFSTLVNALNMKVEVFIDKNNKDILAEFSDFADKVMCINSSQISYTNDAKIYRVGITNASDRGLDMYSNWGPAIQIKHLTLDIDMAQDIVDSISSERIVIVCKDADRDVILSLLKQIGWTSHIQSIVTENDLVKWYEKALRGKYSNVIGDQVLESIKKQIKLEFPSLNKRDDVLGKREYAIIEIPGWFSE